MEKGFILPDGRYLQVIEARRVSVDENGQEVVTEITAADYPEGAQEVPLRPSAAHEWTGTEWAHNPALEPPAPPEYLTAPQFEYLLALTGFGDVWDALAARALETGDRGLCAALKAERSRSRFELVNVLAVVEQFRDAAAQIAPDVDLSETAIRAAWQDAKAYRGLV